MITVHLVDDHTVIRQILQYIIEKTDDIQVVATASNGIEALAQVRSGCPDVIVMDISMPQMGGIEATKQILVLCQLTRILMISAYENSDYIRNALDVGASGYVLKDTIGNDLLIGIRTLSVGKQYFSQKIAAIAEAYLPGESNAS
ncbi:MAG TPA: response regulator transcription factor [Anaerolineales bacterium]|nr:response regulator transcription factor [Anaerolineales bacterium]